MNIVGFGFVSYVGYKGYLELQGITGGYRWFTGGNRGQQSITGGYRGYRGLNGVTGGYKGYLELHGVTGYYRGGGGVQMVYRG